MTKLLLAEYHMLKYRPYVMVTAAVYARLQILKNGNVKQYMNEEEVWVRNLMVLFQAAPLTFFLGKYFRLLRCVVSHSRYLTPLRFYNHTSGDILLKEDQRRE